MEIPTFVGALSSCLDVGAINRFFTANRKLTEKVLLKIRPEGQVDGNRFKMASLDGGQGKSWDYNLQNGQWGDWGKGNNQGGQGIVSFVSASQRCSVAQAVQWLVSKEYLDQKDARKTVQADEGDPLVFPIPAEHAPWEYVREQTVLKKDRALIEDNLLWTYLDVDGSLLGYKYRIDDRRNSKEIFTLTYRAESQWEKKGWDKKLIPAYGLEQLGDGTPTVRILFVEGEKAARKARELVGNRWKVLSFSGVSASSKLWVPDAPFWSDCEVVIWPDNDSPGVEASRQIQLMLENLSNKPRDIREVRVDNIPGLPPKWDIGDWTESCGVDVATEIQNAEEVDSFEALSREWIYVGQQDGFYNLSDRSLVYSATSFDRMYARHRDKRSPSQKFLEDIRSKQAHDVDFVPGEGSIIKAPNGKQFLNEWYATDNYAEAVRISQDQSISDAEIAENAKFFIEHLHRLTGNEVVEPDFDFEKNEPNAATEGRTAFDALAWHLSELVRRPMDKRGWILMLVSEENGTGKTYMRRMMQAVLGATRSRTITVSELLGDYHDWADGLLFYELGEVKSHESTEVYEELKKRHSYQPFSPAMLRDRTENTQLLNIKTKAKKAQRDFLNGCITSNDLFPLALANSSGQEGSDRRLYVLNPRSVLTQRQTEQLFDDELMNRAAWIGAWLMRYRAEFVWNPSWAPITAHKRLMLEKDRVRTENRTDKYELGRFDEFYHMVRWAMSEKVGAMSKEVFSADQIRSICETNRVKCPYDVGKFETILAKAGIYKGPSLRIDGRQRSLFCTDKAWLDRSNDAWKEEFKKSINGPDDAL